jgi:hypothetical protein
MYRTKFSKIRFGMFLLDAGSGFSSIPNPGSGPWIQGPKKHRIPDPDPQHCYPVPTSSNRTIYLISQHQTYMFTIFIIKVLKGTNNFLLAKFELGYQNHAKFRADSETVKKNAIKKLPIKKKLQTKIVKHRECLSPSITVSQKFFSK